jgi:glutaminase
MSKPDDASSRPVAVTECQVPAASVSQGPSISKNKKRLSTLAKKTKTARDFTRTVNLKIVVSALGKESKDDDISGEDVLSFLAAAGLQMDDPRIKYVVSMCQGWKLITEDKATTLLGNNIIRKAMRQDLVVKDFREFTKTFTEVFHEASANLGGGNATYIPQLARQNSNYWGAAVCTTDGQRFGIGDVDVPFCVQSTSKPITYCAALEIHGESKVHDHVGVEPSGRNFNDRCLMSRPGKNSVPHNPYINAGAIMTASLVKMDISEWDRFSYMMGIWQKLSAGTKPSFQNDTFMGERATASRNFCLAYIMEEEQAFPPGTDLHKTLEAYFMWCSIEITSRSMAMLAATLANGGICPTTTERIFTHQTVTNCLSLMMSCGMYDYSGRFAFEIGFPAKSGVSGVLCVVIPGVCGVATFSPRLDNLGNSVRGIDFCTRLSQRFPYHVFSQDGKASRGEGDRKSTRRPSKERKASKGYSGASAQAHEGDSQRLRLSLWWSSARGDEQRIRQLAVRGLDLSCSDYDYRSPLHLAASEGHESMVKLLVALEADVNAKDLHGNTPMMDAVRTGAKWTFPNQDQAAAVGSKRSIQQHSHGLVRYFKGEAILSEGAEYVPHSLLSKVLRSYGILTESDSRFAFLGNTSDPLSREDLENAATHAPVLAKALNGQLVVPNFSLFSEKFEELFLKMTQDTPTSLQQPSSCQKEALNVMTIDGQRLHFGSTDQYFCAGDLVSLALFGVTMELLGLDSIMEFVSLEPSGSESCADVLNSENLPYNPFMWNGVLALSSLLEENFGDATRITAECWAKLCGIDSQTCSIEYDETFEAEDKHKNFHRISSFVHKALHLKKFPVKPSPNTVVNTFFRLRSIKTSTQNLGSIAAVLANGGVNPVTNNVVFQPNTVKCALSMMYSAGCEAQSGELSFKVGVPAKNSREGAILVVWPQILGLCVISPEVTEFGVSVRGWKFCCDLSTEFNLHVLAGTSTASAKQDPSLYHFHTDMELCHELVYAAERGDMMTLSKLHHLGFRLDSVDYDHRSAVHLAAENGQLKVLRYLFRKEVDLKAKDRWGNTPMDGAIRKGQHKTVEFLKQLVGEDDSLFNKLTNVMSSVGAKSRMNIMDQTTKQTRAECPVAAKMGFDSNPNDCMEDVDDDEDVTLLSDDMAARRIQRRYRRKIRARQTTSWA